MIKERQISISRACESLNFSKSNYYEWEKRRVKHSYQSSLLKEVHSIALEFPFYGYRRMTKELHRRNLPINSKKVRKIMRQENLVCRRKKAFKPVTTDSNHSFKIYPNLTKDLIVTGLNQLWVSDITYIRLPYGFAYLATIEDVFSRKCIGWSLGREIDTILTLDALNLGREIDTILTLDALNMAINRRWDIGFSNLTHHSDQGVQYASDAYVEKLNQFGIKISMSRRGNPYDNAFAESFNKTLKVEEVYINEYETFEDALKNIKHFIEIVYNKKRLHSSLGYIPLEEFEMEVLAKI